MFACFDSNDSYSTFVFSYQDEEGLNAKLCTYSITQKEFMTQHWYHCHTCGMVDGVGVCTICARVCHKGHDVTYAKCGSFFCDCGARSDGSCLVSLLLPLDIAVCHLKELDKRNIIFTNLIVSGNG